MGKSARSASSSQRSATGSRGFAATRSAPFASRESRCAGQNFLLQRTSNNSSDRPARRWPRCRRATQANHLSMKIKLLLSATGFAWCASLNAAPLASSTAVQSAPDPASPVITVLSAGTEEPVHSDKGGPAPEGWSAVEVPGPFEGYVHNKDLTKQLDVTPGATVYMAPKDGAGVLSVFAQGDKAEITGLHGAWTQVRLEKTIIGYIHTGPVSA